MTEKAVGKPSAHDRQRVYGTGVDAVDRRSARRRECQSACAERSDHEQNQERAHAVVAEALPHLCEKEDGEAARMTEPVPRRHHCPANSDACEFLASQWPFSRATRYVTRYRRLHGVVPEIP